MPVRPLCGTHTKLRPHCAAPTLCRSNAVVGEDEFVWLVLPEQPPSGAAVRGRTSSPSRVMLRYHP